MLDAVICLLDIRLCQKWHSSFSLHWIILFLNLWQKTKNNGLRQWNIKHYIFHFIMFTGTLTWILQHLSAQVSPVSPNRPPHVQWYWHCWILGHQSSADMQAMFDNVWQCSAMQCETWRQLVSLSAGKSVLIDCWNAFSTGTSPSPGIA